MGSISPFGGGHKGSIALLGRQPLVIDGDACTRVPFSGGASKPVVCRWTREAREEVLEFDNDFNGKDKFVVLADEGLAVSPTVYVSAFERPK